MRRTRGLPWGSLPLLALLLVAGLLPFASALFDSLFHDVYGTRSFAGWDNYRFLLGDRAFALSAALTLAWAAASTLIALSSGYILATILHDGEKRTRALYFALLVPWGMPAFIGVPLWRMLLHGAGGDSLVSRLLGLRIDLIVDPIASFAATLFVDGWMNAPLTAFAIYASLRKIPREMIEAARLDGAGKAAISGKIYLPQIGGTLAALAALQFVRSFKEFTIPFLLTAGGPPILAGITDRTIIGATTTLELYLYELFQTKADYDLAASYAAVLAAATGILVALAIAGRGFAARALRASSGMMTRWATLARRFGGSPRRVVGDFAGARGTVRSIPAADIRSRGGSLRARGYPGRGADFAWSLSRILAAILSTATALLALYALVWTAFSALSSNYVDAFLPRFPSARAFRDIFVEDGLARPFLNTLVVSLATALLAPLMVLPAALRLRDVRPGAKAAAFAAIQALGAAGGMHSLVPLYALARSAGLLGGYAPLLVVYLFHAAPFALFTVAAFVEKAPRSLEEAAELEGAGRGTRLLRITLPLAMPALAAAAMAAFIASWNGFLAPLLFLNDDSLYTIGVRLNSYVGSLASGSPKWNRFAAASIVNVALIAAVMLRGKGPLASADAAESEG